MEVLVIAAHDAELVDHLRAVVHDAIQAYSTSIEITMALPHTPDNRLGDQQLFLWRGYRHHTSVIDFVVDRPPTPQLQPSESVESLVNNATADTDASMALLKRIHKRDRKIKSLVSMIDDLTIQLTEARARVAFVEQEQKQFFEDVQHMKDAYDKLHTSHQKLLWEYLPSKDPMMGAIPRLSKQYDESETAIGPYVLTDVLGYGQYATVFASHSPDAPEEPLAVKAIDKENLLDLITLHRVNSEIASLQDPAIHHPGILALRHVIHTRRHIYLVTERGGKDLFEFFGPREVGIAEETVKSLMLRVALAIQTLHRHNYCHRDLKPENILYDPEHSVAAHRVKIVDFGLCTKESSPEDPMLHDFCGSPGFFAPEILLQEQYDGRKADTWSLGCILLELVVGNDQFASMWMTMYELETLRDHAKFRSLVRSSLEATSAFCHSTAWTYSIHLRSLLLSLLCENAPERLSVAQMLDHAWFVDAGLPRSPSRLNKPLLPSCVSFSEGSGPGDGPVLRRPVSAEHQDPSDVSSPHFSVLLAAHSPDLRRPPSPTKPATPKLSLPSLSPEKPTGTRSPEKTFGKRSQPSSSTRSCSRHDDDETHS